MTTAFVRYEDYLLSDTWKEKRSQAVERAKGKCQLCNSSDRLEVHHRTYERIGDELPDDLTVLCEVCHERHHKKYNSTHRLLGVRTSVSELYDDMERQLKNDHMAEGSTGYVDLDRIAPSISLPLLSFVTSYSGVGKSTLLANIARNMSVDYGMSVVYVTLEESKRELTKRLLCIEARVDSQKLTKGYLSTEEHHRMNDAGTRISNSPFTIVDGVEITTATLGRMFRGLCDQVGAQAIFIDSIDMIQPDNPKESRYEQVSKITRRLKQLTKELSIPIIAAVRMSRPDERYNRESSPIMSDLKHNSSAEHDADVVLTLHVPLDPQTGLPMDGILEVTVAKHRHGPKGRITLAYIQQHGRLCNYAAIQPY